MSRQLCCAVLSTVATLLVAAFPLHAQPNDDGRLYNPPGLEMHGWLDRSLRRPRGENGEEMTRNSGGSSTTVLVERQARTVVQPLLPMMFFNVGESRLAPRYRLITSPAISGGYADTTPVVVKVSEASFGEGLGGQSNTNKYYELLDIIGCRLRRYPDAHLQIEGDYSGEPGESPELATLRAEAVRGHLLTMWGIAPDRIELLKPRQLCAPDALGLRQEEARRVLFLCDEPRVLQPVRFDVLMTNDMLLNLQFAILPRFSSQDIRDLELSVVIGDGLIYRNSIPVSRDSSSYRLHGIVPIMWAIDDPQMLNEQIVAQVVVTLNDGRKFLSNEAKLAFAERRVPTRESDFRVESQQFELPFYDWRDTTISPLQSPMLALMVHGIDSLLSVPRFADSATLSMDEALSRASSAMEAARVQLDSAQQTADAVDDSSDGEEYAEDAPAIDSATVVEGAVDPVAVDSTTVIEGSDSVETIFDNPLSHYGAPVRTLVSTTPRLVITTGVDATETYDVDITSFLSLGSFEPWRELGSYVIKPLMDRSNPPRMLLVDGEELDDRATQMAWLGFDIEEQMGSMMQDQRARFEKAERADSALTDLESPVYQRMQQRSSDLVRGRANAMRDVLIRAGFTDTARVRIVVDTSGPGRSRAWNRSMMGMGARENLLLPEWRYASRVSIVSLRLDPEYSYEETVAPVRTPAGPRVQPDAVDATPSTEEPID